MRKNLITILIVTFVAYAFINHQKKLSIEVQPSENPILEFVDKTKYYINTLTADPPSSSLMGKNNPILQNQPPLEQDVPPPANKDPLVTLKPNSQTPRMKENNKSSEISNKVYNVIYNILHTSQGKELAEKFLLNPPIYDDSKKNSEPSPYHNNSSIDIFQGDGQPAECGDIVEVHYIIRLVSGQEIENTYKAKKPTSFQIGAQQVIKGLEYAVIGMKKDGRRRLVVPPKLAYTDPKISKGLIAGNEFVTIDIELLEIKPALKDWQDKIRIFDKKEEVKRRPLLCSNPVVFNYTISTSDEKILYKSLKPAIFILGSSSVPPAINKAFSNIRRYSTRSVILPSSLLYGRKISFLPKNIKLPAKGMIILDIEIKD